LKEKEELAATLERIQASQKAGLPNNGPPPVASSDLRQTEGSVGLWKKAKEPDRVSSWLQGIGGEQSAQSGTKTPSSLQLLLEKVGGEAQADRLLKAVREAGGLSALEAKMTQADAASSLPESFKDGEADRLRQLVSDSGGIDGLSGLVTQADAASSQRQSLANAYLLYRIAMGIPVEHLDAIEYFHKQVEDKKYDITPYISEALTQAASLNGMHKKLLEGVREVTADRDNLLSRCQALNDKVANLKQLVADRDGYIQELEGYIQEPAGGV
jgi:ribosomal protein L7/L12